MKQDTDEAKGVDSQSTPVLLDQTASRDRERSENSLESRASTTREQVFKGRYAVNRQHKYNINQSLWNHGATQHSPLPLVAGSRDGTR
jgi:hypothetical protein